MPSGSRTRSAYAKQLARTVHPAQIGFVRRCGGSARRLM